MTDLNRALEIIAAEIEERAIGLVDGARAVQDDAREDADRLPVASLARLEDRIGQIAHLMRAAKEICAAVQETRNPLMEADLTISAVRNFEGNNDLMKGAI